MKTKSARRFKRITSALLAVPLAAVVLTTSPVAATTDDAGEVFAPAASTARSGAEARTEAARTLGNAQIELPEFTLTACPEITDSIVRLYSAYFLRAPDEGGFNFWFDNYGSGTWSLPRMSSHFSQSVEFVDTYGSITDAEFIDLIYVNIFGRQADQAGRDYWLGRMASEGLDRGTVMLFFSESPEYIDLTLTLTPLAGEFNWYPEGTVWYCGFGNDVDAALPASATWLDGSFYNLSGSPIAVAVELLFDGEWELWTEDTVASGDYFIIFGEELNDSRLTGIRMTGSDEFYWMIVFAPSITPPVRTGWVAI